MGVLGEAFNLRHTAYFLGSGGQVWECSDKGPRSITALVKQEIGDVAPATVLKVSDGSRSILVETSAAISFKAPGSVVRMRLNARDKTLTFIVNQSPPFVLTGVNPDVRPVVAFKAVGDSVSVIDPSSIA